MQAPEQLCTHPSPNKQQSTDSKLGLMLGKGRGGALSLSIDIYMIGLIAFYQFSSDQGCTNSFVSLKFYLIEMIQN